MTMRMWSPISEMRRMEDVFGRLWGRHAYARPLYVAEATGWAPPLDVRQEDDKVTIKASLPGVAPEDVSATIEDGTLTIGGKSQDDGAENDGRYSLRERRHGEFRRAVRLPETLDGERADASYENGVLTITLPKRESDKPKPLTIKVGG